MPAADAFFDTNVLLYLVSDDPTKADQAEALLSSGGVISVFSEVGTPSPTVAITGGTGSYQMWTAGAKLRATAGSASYVAAASEFQTDGYREHSSARRDLFNAKLRFDATDATRVTLIGNYQYQPET